MIHTNSDLLFIPTVIYVNSDLSIFNSDFLWFQTVICSNGSNSDFATCKQWLLQICNNDFD